MGVLTAYRKNKTEYIPEYVYDLNKEECIACGRCYKSCPSNVFDLCVEEDEDGEEIKYMTIAHDEDCIGCKACKKVCPKGCLSHRSIEV